MSPLQALGPRSLITQHFRLTLPLYQATTRAGTWTCRSNRPPPEVKLTDQLLLTLAVVLPFGHKDELYISHPRNRCCCTDSTVLPYRGQSLPQQHRPLSGVGGTTVAVLFFIPRVTRIGQIAAAWPGMQLTQAIGCSGTPGICSHLFQRVNYVIPILKKYDIS